MHTTTPHLGAQGRRARGVRRALVRLVAIAALSAIGLTAGSALLEGRTAATAATASCTPGAGWGTVRSDYADQVLTLVNQHRASIGAGPLRISSALRDSAVWKAQHMAEYGYMSHDDPAPPLARTWYSRVQSCGYTRGGAGENIAYGYPSPQSVMTGWLNSAGHRANIENSSYRVIGIGAASSDGGTLYWAQNFGTFDDSGATPTPTATATATATPKTTATATATATPKTTATATATATPKSTATATATPKASATPTPTASPTPAPTATPAPGGITALPSSVGLFSGTPLSGGVPALRAADGSYFVLSSSGGTSWYGMMSGVPNGLTSLSVTYRGMHSASCTQNVWIWNWTRGSWTRLDSRAAGALATVTPTVSGALAEYVSGSSGPGNVAVAVTCGRSDSGPVITSSDLLSVTYR